MDSYYDWINHINFNAEILNFLILNSSFENSFCRDYVSEKFFKVLEYDIVPVVFGRANYSKIAPAKSYIDAQDFETPQKLAEYLQYLDKNETAYAEYFEWKKYFKVTLKNSIFCQLCKFLNDDKMPAKTYPSISKWWYVESNCTLRGNFPWTR